MAHHFVNSIQSPCPSAFRNAIGIGADSIFPPLCLPLPGQPLQVCSRFGHICSDRLPGGWGSSSTLRFVWLRSVFIPSSAGGPLARHSANEERKSDQQNTVCESTHGFPSFQRVLFLWWEGIGYSLRCGHSLFRLGMAFRSLWALSVCTKNEEKEKQCKKCQYA